MMALPTLSLLAVLLLLRQVAAQPAAPAPSSGPLNLTGILAKGGQFTTLIRLMSETQVSDQIMNQLNNSHDGVTLLAPTDNAFNNLKPGTLNGLSRQDQVNLILYHVMPKFYTLENLLTVSNPVRTQFSDDGLNFTGQSHQVNVSSGIVTTQVNNALNDKFPLAVYQVDSVLLPPTLFGAKPPAAAAEAPAKSTPAGAADKSGAKADAPASEDKSGATRSVVGLVVGVVGLAVSLLS